MSKRRKPSVYRKIRGITDADIRNGFMHLFQHKASQQEQINELRNVIAAMAPRVFPEKAAEYEAEEAARKLAYATADPVSINDCGFCYGRRQFETKHADGSIYTEPCKECRPEEFQASLVRADVAAHPRAEMTIDEALDAFKAQP